MSYGVKFRKQANTDLYKLYNTNLHEIIENSRLSHRGLQCLVAMELKIGKFKPEYISKMDFYLEALDRQVKKENENPSVGLLLCASKNDEVVEYAMSRTMSPMLVSQYQLQLPDKTILEKKLQQLVNIPQIED